MIRLREKEDAEVIFACWLSGLGAASYSAILEKVIFNICNYCHAILCSSPPESKCSGVHPRSVFSIPVGKKN